MRTSLSFFFFLRRVLDFLRFFRDCSRSRAPRIFLLTRLFPFPERKRRSKKKKGKKRRKFISSLQGNYNLELFIGNIIYRWNVFRDRHPFLSSSRQLTEFRYNDKILPGNVCSGCSYCFRQFFNNNYASKRLNNGTGFLLFFQTPPFFFRVGRDPWCLRSQESVTFL